MTRYRPWILGAVFGAAALVALPLTGVVPHGVSASLTEGYRGLATRQSVTLRSLVVLPPADLADPARLQRAAGHYQQLCRDCHGAPGHRPARFASDLSPPPPVLGGAPAWRPAARLFVTLRDGIAHSAMPAWPAPGRADEIWDMVAFLQALAGLPADDYSRLAGSGGCASCHDRPAPAVPRLDLQSPAYLAQTLRAYRDGLRASGVMQTAAHPLSDADIERLAAAFGQARGGAPDLAADPPALASHGDQARDIPACLSCHGSAARADYPRLAGQDAQYLRRRLEQFADPQSPRAGAREAIMRPIAAALSPAEREMLSTWFATRPQPGPNQGQPVAPAAP